MIVHLIKDKRTNNGFTFYCYLAKILCVCSLQDEETDSEEESTSDGEEEEEYPFYKISKYVYHAFLFQINVVKCLFVRELLRSG